VAEAGLFSLFFTGIFYILTSMVRCVVFGSLLGLFWVSFRVSFLGHGYVKVSRPRCVAVVSCNLGRPWCTRATMGCVAHPCLVWEKLDLVVVRVQGARRFWVPLLQFNSVASVTWSAVSLWQCRVLLVNIIRSYLATCLPAINRVNVGGCRHTYVTLSL